LQWKPDVLFCFNTSRLDQRALLSIPAATRIHYSPDDVSNPENVTDDYLKHEGSWDLVVTTKRHNIEEITQRSGARVHMVWSAYDPAWHHPTPLLNTLPQYSVGFIGNARPDRLDLIRRLGSELGSSLLIAGERWNRHLPHRGRHASVTGPRYGEAFSYTVRTIRTNLVLLNSSNRDSHTCRSFEVPASGGLVLAERTAEHQEMLEDGKEALFFSSEEELLEQIARVEASPAAYASMRYLGHRRIVTGGHTYVDRAREILQALEA
jgi:spore maturation protein CgeB